MHQDQLIQDNSKIKAVTYLAIAGNVALAVIKAWVGAVSGSMALVADASHSLSDIATDLAVLLGVRLGAKEPDKTHPYGHGKTETLLTTFIGIVLVLVGSVIVWRAAVNIAENKHVTPHYAVLAAALLSIVVKEFLYRITKTVAVKLHSSILYANAWHHRSDALSSVAVVAGFVALKFGFTHGDQIAAIAVGLMIILVAAQILVDCLNELTEAAVDDDTIRLIKNVINADSAVRNWHRLRTRSVGRQLFLDLHILVEPDLSIAAAHEISERLENTLHQKLTRPANIIIHIEPDIPQLRK